MFWTELCFILVALMIGARIGGVFLGMVGGLGVGVMVFIFGLTPSTPPIDVILIILSVVLAAASLQASGGVYRCNAARVGNQRRWRNEPAGSGHGGC